MSAFQNTSKAYNDITLGKEVKTIMAVDTSLHSLRGYLATFFPGKFCEQEPKCWIGAEQSSDFLSLFQI